jgi:hypothetical protein
MMAGQRVSMARGPRKGRVMLQWQGILGCVTPRHALDLTAIYRKGSHSRQSHPTLSVLAVLVDGFGRLRALSLRRFR